MAPRQTSKPKPEDQFKDVVPCAYAMDENDEFCKTCNGKFLTENGQHFPATDCQGYTLPQPVDTEGGNAEDVPPPELNPDDIMTGTKCSICGANQFETPSGVTCDNGHGGAPSEEEVIAQKEATDAAAKASASGVPENVPDYAYVPRAKTTLIKAESGLSAELSDRNGVKRWYRFAYTEERSVPEDCSIEEERAALWNDVNLAVDKQLEDTLLFLAAK